MTKLHDALPHGLLHRRESRSSTPACYRSNRPSHSVSRRRLPFRGAPRTQLLPARLSQRQPVGVHAAGQTTNCGPTFRARAPRGAPPRRAAAPEKKHGPDGAQGEPDSPRRSTPKCSTGKTFFCRQSRETCESGLRSRRSRGVFIVYISLSEGLPPEPTSPSARRPRRHPVVSKRRGRATACSCCSYTLSYIPRVSRHSDLHTASHAAGCDGSWGTLTDSHKLVQSVGLAGARSRFLNGDGGHFQGSAKLRIRRITIYRLRLLLGLQHMLDRHQLLQHHAGLLVLGQALGIAGQLVRIRGGVRVGVRGGVRVKWLGLGLPNPHA